MKGVILASGMGRRIQTHYPDLPKCLLEVNGQTLLERQLNSLAVNGLKDILITTGYQEEKIKKFLKRRHRDLKINYVYNPRFAETNYIYSLWLARDEILDNDIILLHGDLVYDISLVRRTINQNRSSVLVNKMVEVPLKDFKARVIGGLVREIGVNVFGKGAYFCMPMYKILKGDLNLWFDKIEEFVKGGEINCYAENAFNLISGRMRLHPLFHEKEFCMEIDNAEDLEKARKILGLKN